MQTGGKGALQLKERRMQSYKYMSVGKTMFLVLKNILWLEQSE